MKRFCLDINISVDLDIDQIWPDGDAPENPTVEDVRERFLEDGRGVLHAADEWALGDDADLSITEYPS